LVTGAPVKAKLIVAPYEPVVGLVPEMVHVDVVIDCAE
jgi:hypothetical protein